NEAGLYLGLDIKPNYNWQFSAYFDTWSHPWLRFGVDAPSKGYEYLAQARYRVKRKLDVYIRFRDEYRQRNRPNNDTNIDFLIWERRTQLRINLAYIVSKGLEISNREEMILFKEDDLPVSRGFMIYQDLIVKPPGTRLSFTGRFAIFDTDDFDSRIYAFENDILYSFSIPAFAYRGMRYYLNMRYRPTRKLSLEFRIAQTYLSNRDFFGSGLELIEGNTRTEIKMQAQYKF
ncbi:MAG: helix-hairpin-helix domain-containing protein, partial [Bacteroidota bacterium]